MHDHKGKSAPAKLSSASSAATPVREAAAGLAFGLSRVMQMQRIHGNRTTAGWLAGAVIQRGQKGGKEKEPPVTIVADEKEVIKKQWDVIRLKSPVLKITEGDLEQLTKLAFDADKDPQYFVTAYITQLTKQATTLTFVDFVASAATAEVRRQEEIVSLNEESARLDVGEKAWEDPDWSTTRSANCYAYAADCKYPKGYEKSDQPASPGVKGLGGTKAYDKGKDQLRNMDGGAEGGMDGGGAVLDGMIPVSKMPFRPSVTLPSTFNPDGYKTASDIPPDIPGYYIAALIGGGVLMHWYRRDKSGRWTHKNQGHNPVVNYYVADQKKYVITDSNLSLAIDSIRLETGQDWRFKAFYYVPEGGIDVAAGDYEP